MALPNPILTDLFLR